MMASLFLERRCVNARRLGSAALDGELSGFEQRLLHDHLRACEACATVVGEMARVTELVRAAPMEHPTSAVTAPARLRRRRRFGRAARASVAVASFAAAGALGVMAGASSRSPATPPPAAVAEQPSLTQVLAMTRTQYLWRAGLPRSQGSPHGRIL